MLSMIGVKLSRNDSSMGKCERVLASEIRDDFALSNMFTVNVQLCKRNDQHMEKFEYLLRF